MATDKLIYGTDEKPVDILEEFTKYPEEAREIKATEKAQVLAKKKERWQDVLKYDTGNMNEVDFFSAFRMRAPQKVKNLLYTTIAELALLYPNTKQPETINEIKALINQASLEGKLKGDILGNAITLTKVLDSAKGSTTIGIESPILNVSGDIDKNRYDISKDLKLGNIDLGYRTTFDEGKQTGSTYSLDVPFDIKALEGSVGLERVKNKYNTSNLLNLDSTYDSGNLNVGLTGSAKQDKSGITSELRPSFKYKVPTDYGTLSALASKDIVEGGDANALLSYTYGDTGHPSDEDEFFRISAELDPVEGDKKAFVGFKTKFQEGGLAQIPSIPQSTGIDNLDQEVVEEEEVTWKDLPPPGSLLMRKPSEREWQAMKNFGKGILGMQKEVALDMLPVIGEKRMYGYYDEELELFQKAVKERDYPAIGVHGVGTQIMAAGTWPWWLGGALVRPLARNVGKAYRIATAPFRKKASGYMEQGNELIGYLGPQGYGEFSALINTPRMRVAYEHWLAGLPEYRRVADPAMVRTNLREFQQLDDAAIDLLDMEGRTAAAVAAQRRDATTPSQVLAETRAMVKDHKVQHQVAVKDKTTLLESGSVPTKITEKFTLGESANPIRVGPQTNVSEFLGSEAYDVIATQNFKQMPVKNMSEYLAGLVRSGKLKKEEMFDSGLLKLDANNKVVGGAFFELSANTPNMIISKQDILKMLKEQPAQNLKVQTYRQSRVSPAAYYDLYASASMMGNTIDSALQKAIFLTKNTAARSKLRAVQKDVQALEKSMYLTANDLNFENSMFGNEFFLPSMERMTALMPKLDEGTQQVLRAYMENTKKINKLANDSLVTQSGPVRPLISSHVGYMKSYTDGGQSTAGGFNYTEKVIYLDEAIPFNTSGGRKRFTTHFPLDNPIAHSRSKTRYNRKGKEIETIDEIQSDTIQPYWGEGTKGKREGMISPYGTRLTEAHVRRELKDINAQMEPLLPKNLKKEVTPGQWVERSITDSELKTLKELDARKAKLRQFLTKQDVKMTEESHLAVRHAREMSQPEKVDFFPFVRRTGGVAGYDMLMLKALIDDAMRTGKSGITIVPAGIHGRSDQAGMHMYYGDVKGTKKGALDEKSLKKLGKKTAPDAEGVSALKKIVKQIEKEHGIKLKISQQPVFNYDPANLYAIENKSGQIISSFKTRANRDFVLAKKNEMSPSGEGFTALNLAEGAPGTKDLNKPFFKSIVLEWSDEQAKQLSKKKMSTYREGGLVAIAPKREYFAAVI